MPTKIIDGEYAINSHGCFIEADNIDEILQRALAYLKIRRGSFSLDPQLGSELFTLDMSTATEDTLKAYISEALSSIPEIEVMDIQRNQNKPDNALSITVYVKVGNQKKQFNL